MNKLILIGFIMVVLIGTFSCTKTTKKQIIIVPLDTTITQEKAFTELFLDSIEVNNFIAADTNNKKIAADIKNFYNARNNQFAWFFEDGLDEHALNFWNLQGYYMEYMKDSSIYNPTLETLIDTFATHKITPDPKNPLIIKTELLLTQHFFKYAKQAFQGRETINQTELDWFIPKQKINEVAYLDSIVKHKTFDKFFDYAPVNKQYNLLLNQLIKYNKIENNLTQKTITIPKKQLQLTDTAAEIIPIKQYLLATNDLTSPDTTPIFTDSLLIAIKRFQNRHGIKEDGIINNQVLTQINTPINQRIRQILLNLERIRWMQVPDSTDYLLINIPQFELYAYENGKYVWNMNVVVGKNANKTVIFTGNMQTLVFCPYWNVPSSIVKNEMIGKLSPSYLKKNNMEITGYNGKLPIVRQKPGKNNALGKVKFLFPNQYNIYLHDTPAKSFFKEDKRSFSHGCIRLSNPPKLAQWVLKKNPNWTNEKIQTAMDSDKEQHIKLPQQIPVIIGYFTAFVDPFGKLNFRDDIYGHDARLAEKLFAKN